MIMNALSKINAFLLEIFFPRECLRCGKAGTYFCMGCAEKLFDGGRMCKSTPSIAKIYACVAFDEAPYLKPVIHHFKYHFDKDLCRPLGMILAHHFKKRFNSDNIVLLPVPLHKNRLKYRAFNQSELLAREIGLPVMADMLQRRRDTKPQAKLDREERLKNLTNAFELKMGTQVYGKTVVLIDDVCTTGSTLEECAKVLKDTGAKEIYGFVIASG